MHKKLKPGTPRDNICPFQESSPTIWQRDLRPHRGTVPSTQEDKDRAVFIGV